tara:strand:- start:607 stop:777 length:171 start_codon:yes stop_codon:yes gene_type:complete
MNQDQGSIVATVWEFPGGKLCEFHRGQASGLSSPRKSSIAQAKNSQQTKTPLWENH